MDKIKKIIRIAELDQFEREKFKADIDFHRLPTWRQAVLEGDRLSDGSDEQEYYKEEV